MQTEFKVLGRDAEGNAVFYTGRAGQGFVSVREADAFAYGSLEAARRRATNLNEATPLHGIRFYVPSPDAA